MMICKADFEELFPHIFKPDDPDAALEAQPDNRAQTAPRRQPAPADAFAPARAIRVLSALPAAGAAWSMFNAYDHMTRRPSDPINADRR